MCVCVCGGGERGLVPAWGESSHWGRGLHVAPRSFVYSPSADGRRAGDGGSWSVNSEKIAAGEF